MGRVDGWVVGSELSMAARAEITKKYATAYARADKTTLTPAGHVGINLPKTRLHGSTQIDRERFGPKCAVRAPGWLTSRRRLVEGFLRVWLCSVGGIQKS